VIPARAVYLKTLCGDDKNFGSASYGIELAKDESAIGRVWASGRAEIINQFTRQQLAKDFNITKICLKAFAGGVLEWPTCKSVVEDAGAAYALLWSVKGDKITPDVTPEHRAFLKTLRGDDKNFGTESYGFELAKNESAIGSVWASGCAETIDKSGATSSSRASNSQRTSTSPGFPWKPNQEVSWSGALDRLARVLSRMQGPRMPCSGQRKVTRSHPRIIT